MSFKHEGLAFDPLDTCQATRISARTRRPRPATAPVSDRDGCPAAALCRAVARRPPPPRDRARAALKRRASTGGSAMMRNAPSLLNGLLLAGTRCQGAR